MRTFLALATAATFLSCGDPTSRPSSTSTPTPQSEAQTLELAGRCIQEGYGSFLTAAQRLATATEQLATSPADDGLRTEAREAWVQAIERWQEQEAMHLGPAALASSPGGQGLRDEVYSWPLVSRCVVEQTLVNQSYQEETFPSVSLVNARGLAALDYLLFYDGSENNCGPTASINSGGTWAALGADELRSRRAAYVRVAAADVLRRAQALADAWAPDKGNFAGILASAGPGNATFPSSQGALNALSDVLIAHAEKEVRDLKLGRPLGLLECTTGTCPDTLESRHARRSKQHLLANLRGVRKVLLGCNADGTGGLDELLRAREAADLADRMEVAIDNAIKTLEAVTPDDLEAALSQNPDALKNAHAAIKGLTDLLKNEFVLVLGLKLPTLVAGDND